MVIHFNSFAGLANFLATKSIAGVRHNCEQVIDDVGRAVSKEAEDSIGHYQTSIGQYPAWAPLAQATLERKGKLGLGMGGNPDTPLYATGAFKNDVSHVVDKPSLTAVVGTKQPHIVYTELGTAGPHGQPPRPVFAPALLRAAPPMLPSIQMAIGLGLAGVRGRSFAGSSISPYIP